MKEQETYFITIEGYGGPPQVNRFANIYGLSSVVYYSKQELLDSKLSETLKRKITKSTSGGKAIKWSKSSRNVYYYLVPVSESDLHDLHVYYENCNEIKRLSDEMSDLDSQNRKLLRNLGVK